MSSKKRIKHLPFALDDVALIHRLASSKLSVFLDYDGTLAPIADHPAKAILSTETRSVLRKLASLCRVVILSGRDVEDVRRMVAVKKITYCGSHGFDIMDRNGKRIANENWNKFLPILTAVERRLSSELAGVSGILVERKRFAIAVHYRNVAKSDLVKMKQRFNRVCLEFPKLKKKHGKKVLELLPNVKWNKGEAFLALYNKLSFKSTHILPIFIGDDLSDEEVFRAMKNLGVGIVVGRSNRDTYADYSLQDDSEVRIFLARLVENLENRSTRAKKSKLNS